MSFNIEVEGGSSVRLPTAGKYCDRDIVVTAINDGGSYDEGYEQGKIDGDISKYATVFRCTGVAFPEGYELSASTLKMVNFPQFDGATGIKKVTLRDLSLEKQYNATTFVYACESVEEVVFTDGVRINAANYMCTNAYGLQRIIGAMDMSGNTSNNMWTGCRALVEIRFVPFTIGANIAFRQSAGLSNASIQSIVEGLADLTGQTTQTLTLHADVGAKLTDEQKASVTAKNWTLAY